MPFWHDDIGMTIFGSMQASVALLLGRKTYAGLAAAFGWAAASVFFQKGLTQS